MNLIFRMMALLIKSFFKPRITVEKPINFLSLRVLPNDIDINLHMNNGRYLTICDLSRADLLIRTGLAKTMIKEKWIPVISEHTMKYKRGLKLFQKYIIKTEITGWDKKSFKMLHTFIVGERIVAEGTSCGVVLSKRGSIAPEEAIRKVELRLNAKNI